MTLVRVVPHCSVVRFSLNRTRQQGKYIKKKEEVILLDLQADPTFRYKLLGYLKSGNPALYIAVTQIFFDNLNRKQGQVFSR